MGRTRRKAAKGMCGKGGTIRPEDDWGVADRQDKPTPEHRQRKMHQNDNAGNGQNKDAAIKVPSGTSHCNKHIEKIG